MCGIAGIFDSRLPPDELRRALAAMAGSMLHRGPDQGAVRLFPQVAGGLAVRRLAFVDLEGGDQPIANEDGSVVALLNGEIYNHHALRRELEAAGHRFATRCDTEVVAHLYEQHGDRFLSRLEGMFALAVLDLDRRRLLLARDGPGMKPLYHARTDGGFAFASEARALFGSGLVRPRPALPALDVYLGTGFIPAPRTLFEGVERLPAGCFAVCDASGLRQEAFWRFRFAPDEPPLSDLEYVDELERRLEAAVASHLAADVPIGCFLSGGWDSSLVAAFAARHRGSRLQTFSIVFPDDPGVDESRHSRQVAAWLGTDHREVEYRSSMLPDLLPRLVRQLEEPIAASPVALADLLASLAAGHVKGVVGGEGADELFGGYQWFRSDGPYRLREVLPRPLARLAARHVHDPRVRRWLRIAAAADPRAADAEWFRCLTPEEKAVILKPELRSGGPDMDAVLIPDDLASTCRDGLQRRLAHDLRGRLPEAILFKHDKLAMAHSLEVRMPFLDRGVVELAARLPPHLAIHRGREKVIVAELARRHLPPEIAARRKQGLAYPRSSWVDPPAGDRVRDLLLDEAERGPFLRAPLERFLSRRRALRRYDRPVACLAGLHTWWTQVLRPPAGGASPYRPPRPEKPVTM